MIAFIKLLRLSRIAIIAGLLTILVFSLASAVNPAMAAGSATKPAEGGFWLWAFLGRLHPMVVHFPIGLLFIALLFEGLAWRQTTAQYANTVNTLVLTGAASAVVSVVLGLVLANTETYGSSVLQLHQWLGIGTMVLACASYWLYNKSNRKAGLATRAIVESGAGAAAASASAAAGGGGAARGGSGARGGARARASSARDS